jgi:glycosyltransferase involved in cell wall biosynthesis
VLCVENFCTGTRSKGRRLNLGLVRRNEAGQLAASTMRFSVIIPTFNRSHLLADAIKSALEQTHTDREILVIDDGSTDPTADVAASFGQPVRYIRKENGGKASALNLGIAHAKGELFVVLDDDDLLPPFALARHAEALRQKASAGFSYGRFARFSGRTLPLILTDREYIPTEDPRRLVIKLMENCFLPNPCWAVRREVQSKAGAYADRMPYSEDYDMILRLARVNEGIFIDDLVLFQRKHESLRGPLSERIRIVDPVGKWLKYDALLFEKIDAEWDLASFHPFATSPNSIGGEALALLQKGVILFQRKVYDGAMGALARYRRHLDGRPPTRLELRIATGLLGCRYGIDDLLGAGPMGKWVTEAVSDTRWPLSMRVAFATQMRWRLRQAVMAGEMRSALKLAQFARQAFGMAAAAAALGSRYNAGAWEV